MVHYMNLNKEPFDMIASGKKTIELRLYDEKRRKIKVDDEIVFTSLPDGAKLNTRVKKLYVFDSFEHLYESLPLDKCGYEQGEEASPVDMEKYYSRERQQANGVVGIELDVI